MCCVALHKPRCSIKCDPTSMPFFLIFLIVKMIKVPIVSQFDSYSIQKILITILVATSMIGTQKTSS